MKFVEELDDKENDEGDDEEVDDVLEEVSVINRGVTSF